MEFQTSILRFGPGAITETTSNSASWRAPHGTPAHERWEPAKRLASIALAFSLVATLLASLCASGAPEVLYDKQTKLVEQFASIVRNSSNDCNLMGDKLVSLVGNNAALIGEAEKLTAEQRQQMPEKYLARRRTARAGMADRLVECHRNAKVKAAMETVSPVAPLP